MDESINYPWRLIENWMTDQECEVWKKLLCENITWERPTIFVYGNYYPVPRLTTFLADSHIKYKYSGHTHIGNGWPNWFLPLLKKVSLFCEVDFNGCLLNCYEDGKDTMGWHSDDESELNQGVSICSLSFGASRDFCLKKKNTNLKVSLLLNSGDLLIMKPECQKEWKHSLPPRRKVVEPRFNLTFRQYLL